MNKYTPQQSVLFPDLADRDVIVVADEPVTSSDGGSILLKRADQRLGLIDALAACLPDRRQHGKIDHSIRALLRQRIYGIACGYEDANDVARLRADPVHRMLVADTPDDTRALASQPSLSRLENGVDAATNDLLERTLGFRTVADLSRRHRHARRIIIEFDGTDDPAHGAQQLSFFNAFYDTNCFQALLGFIRFDDRSEQHLISASLHSGIASLVAPALERLRAIVPMLRTFFPHARLCVRLDAGFATPEMFEFFDRHALDYVVGMPANAVLTRLAEPSMIMARARAAERGTSARVYAEALYQAKTWDRERRVIIKAEVVTYPGREPRDNARFVMTNLRQSPRYLYAAIYAARGDVENRIKELKNDLAIDRTSCHAFEANRFRLTLTAAAYVLWQEVRYAARGTSLASAQVHRLQLTVIKVAARVSSSVRRIVLHLPSAFAYLREWTRIAQRLKPRTA